MLSGQTRPVPSKAALRILYQLAYISSGTAVGVGVLCAEERRRRTQVVQKIADNAKKIRQSPRYYQNAALGVPDEEYPYAEGPEADWTPEHSTTPAAGTHRSRRWHAKEQEAIKGPGLPSVVDRGYTHYQGHDSNDPAWGTKGPAWGTEIPVRGDEKHNARSLACGVERRTSPVKRASAKQHQPPHDGPETTSRAKRQRVKLRRPLEAVANPVMETTADAVRGACSTDDLKRATSLILASKGNCAIMPEYWDLVDEVFSSALRSGHLSLCIDLLQSEKDFLPRNKLFMVRCEALLKACDKQAAYELVFNLFVPRCQFGPACFNALSSEAHEIIALACTKHGPMTTPKILKRFKESYSRVPGSSRGRILQSRTSLRLKSMWQTTHDYAKVQAEIGEMSFILREAKDEEALRQLTLTALDIQISANRTDIALDTLNMLHKSVGASGDTVSVAAVLFAKQQAWPSVERVMALGRSMSTGSIDANTTTRLNHLIQLFARQHSSAATWKFVTSAVCNLGFTPNQATTEIMLQTFVSRKALGLIPRWLRYVKIMGYRFQLDARVAAKLLTRYYLEYRPSHVLVMWFCKNLIHFAPSLAGTEFVDLVKEAIGYDLRHITAGGQLALQETCALDRLGRLEEVKDAMPSPGHTRRDEELIPLQSAPRLTYEKVSTSSLEHHFGTSNQYTNPEFGDDSQAHQANQEGSLDEMDIQVPKKNFRWTHSASPSSRVPDEPTHESLPRVEAEPEPVSFELLRPSYGLQDRPAHETSSGPATSWLREQDSQYDSAESSPERDMILALSLKQYDKVLSLYHASLDAIGLSRSPLALEVAVQASLRTHSGDQSKAEELLTKAREAGMNTTCAMGPIIIHQIRNIGIPDAQDASRLRHAVIDYYRMNEENGWPVKHHVAVAAAQYLIKHHKLRQGVDILDSIYRSDWAAARAMDITAMTVFLKGYTQLRSEDGIQWVVQTVLDENLRIDQTFIRGLKFARGKFVRQSQVRGEPGEDLRLRDLLTLVSSALRRCSERRAQQVFKAKKLGNKLVACIAKCVNAESLPAVDVTARGHLEDDLFGERVPLPGPPAPSHKRDLHFSRRRARIASSLRMNPQLRRWRRGAKVDDAWLKQYRAFLRRDLVMSDGRLAAFRYRLRNEGASRRRRRTDPGVYQIQHEPN